jgi:hypothetical protein
MAKADPPGDASMAVPAAVAFGVGGAMAFGFGAGFGARSYTASNAYKELLEKFPDKPTPEAEALAKSGATKALLAGTALAGLMGVGAVMFARSYGVNSAADFADEIKKWLPTREGLQVTVSTLSVWLASDCVLGVAPPRPMSPRPLYRGRSPPKGPGHLTVIQLPPSLSRPCPSACGRREAVTRFAGQGRADATAAAAQHFGQHAGRARRGGQDVQGV